MMTNILELNLAFQRLLSDDPEAEEQKDYELGDEEADEDEDEDEGDGDENAGDNDEDGEDEDEDER